MTEAEGLSGADELAGKLRAMEALAAAGPRLSRADEERVAAARERVAGRLRTARAAEAEAWERDRPAREARARQQEEDLAGLQRQNREREATAAGERERATRLEAERGASAKVQAERGAAEADAQRRRDDAALVAKRQEQARAEDEVLDRMRRNAEAQLAVNPCNKVEVRRQLMEAANAMDGARYGGRKLLDLTRGRTNAMEPNATRACFFDAEWSSGQRGLVTITLRKNLFGQELIEVRPY